MRFTSFTALFAASNALLGVSAGPIVAKRQDQTPSPTATPTVSGSASSSGSGSAESTSSSSSSRSAASLGLIEVTDSAGQTKTIEFVAPRPTDAESTESATDGGASKPTLTFSPTGQPVPASTNFPRCGDEGNPFCLPSDQSKLYVGKTYYATWNPKAFAFNSSVTIKILWANDSLQETWSSDKLDSTEGYIAVQMQKDWMQTFDMYNLTFAAVVSEPNNPSAAAKAIDGPSFTLQNEPPHHYEPPKRVGPNKSGLMIGLPVSLGFLLFVIVGLWFGMRKHRTIGLGNVMGRRNRGYGTRKSKRERLGLSKEGAIRLEDREAREGAPRPQHVRGDSLGSLVSDDEEIRPAPRGNQFRDEVQRQRTGR
ncbi:hypothetical protein BDV95DRAFT_611947 [Massariosphaeria phaeospora]|uniref:Uncharacterized protein n=1 Tax=Massariosphaeria phaeospora TaxID=100035 RepID=A0A7C8I618_9PLEO|nr:hypothetical protein BDV95DRAFT_611947 [Massariosphaeria phaeospora]